MGYRYPYPNPQKRRIYGLDSPQQERQGKLQIQEAGATPQENRLIFKDTHPAIIDEETWNVVQRLREAKRVRELLTGYDTEQKTLDEGIERLQAEIDR